MDNLIRMRRAGRQVVRVQRRIWILQAMFWPAVVLGVAASTAAVFAVIRRRHTAAQVDQDHVPTPSDDATAAAG